MKYFYSKSADSFYPSDYKDIYLRNGTWPGDSVEVTEEQFINFSLSTRPNNKKRDYIDGFFVWVDDGPTIHQLHVNEKLWRNFELKRSDIELNKVQDSDPKSTGSVSDWRNYRKALRAWPESVNFPNKDLRPISPDI